MKGSESHNSSLMDCACVHGSPLASRTAALPSRSSAANRSLEAVFL